VTRPDHASNCQCERCRPRPPTSSRTFEQRLEALEKRTDENEHRITKLYFLVGELTGKLLAHERDLHTDDDE